MSEKKTTARDRVCHLLHARWHDNQTDMGREVGCSQSTISKIVNGQQPGKKVLKLIAACKDVNPDWLFHGAGKPSTRGSRTRGSRRGMLPIARRPSDRPPADASEMAAVIREFDRPSCYWLAVQPEDGIRKDNDLAVRDADLLLVETDRNYFPPLNRGLGRICVVRIRSGSEGVICLGTVDCEENNPSVLNVELFDLDSSPPGIPHLQAKGQPKEGGRGYARRVKRSAADDFGPRRINVNDVVGVCMMLFRRSL